MRPTSLIGGAEPFRVGAASSVRLVRGAGSAGYLDAEQQQINSSSGMSRPNGFLIGVVRDLNFDGPLARLGCRITLLYSDAAGLGRFPGHSFLLRFRLEHLGGLTLRVRRLRGFLDYDYMDASWRRRSLLPALP